MKLLEIDGLSADYGGTPVLDSLDLRVEAGERVALIGPNGCGKSTLLRSIVGQTVRATGGIRLKGEEIRGLATDQRMRGGIGYLRQERNVFSGLTIAENLELAGCANGTDQQEVLASFPLLRGREAVRAGLLSGGERQALASAMILSRKVDLLLLDEPVSGLSAKNAAKVLEGIAERQRVQGFAMVVIEHRLRLLRPHVDRVVIMVRGQIVEDTNDPSILEDPERLGAHYQL